LVDINRTARHRRFVVSSHVRVWASAENHDLIQRLGYILVG
jgi:hypothetical protein